MSASLPVLYEPFGERDITGLAAFLGLFLCVSSSSSISVERWDSVRVSGISLGLMCLISRDITLRDF